MPETWLALMIGNSRLHWGLFRGETLIDTWDTNYIDADTVQQLAKCENIGDFFHLVNAEIETDISPWELSPIQIAIASVVPAQFMVWQNYPLVKIITLEHIPIKALYSTFGIDRALAVVGAGSYFGFPALVIDTGTALTFTGVDKYKNLIGGAILPGLGLQLATLGQKTGQLPQVEIPKQLPQRFALNTSEAIQSGIIHTLLGGIRDFVENWWQDFPQGQVVMTGGDRVIIQSYLKSLYPQLANHIIIEANLIFWGLSKIMTTTNQ
ncbi:pantothenate kinase [Calothrix sp. PCC 6303]|uniref:pantothenate kinase n=1 Tax=Calothrix sp. PCC 6303 TaxID=1170562 RepID=UPI0002A01589|nr:pantothenate kinase [Calothrix sp. PCC 6303]AFZ00690.1 putative transcriptional acitvator, Baf family [Calothrix sp. PCC 6303]